MIFLIRSGMFRQCTKQPVHRDEARGRGSISTNRWSIVPRMQNQKWRAPGLCDVVIGSCYNSLYLGDDMDISVGVVAAGSTIHREVAELADDLREAVGRLNGVSSADLIETATLGGAKGVGQVLGAFVVNLPGGVIPGIVEVLKSVAERPSQLPVIRELTTGSSKVYFDPKQIEPADSAALCEALRSKTAAG